MSFTSEYSATLSREKISFIGKSASPESDGPLMLRSNRFYVELPGPFSVEHLVIRTQTVPTALRMASKMMFNFFRNGPFTGRTHPYDFQAGWNSVVSGYDRTYMPGIWAAVYINGEPAFKTASEDFKYADVIEKCAIAKGEDYDAAMKLAQTALQKLAEVERIDHETTVASVFHDKDAVTRGGIIVREEEKQNTFNFHAHGGERENRIVDSLRIAAAFTDGINLRRTARNIQRMIRAGEVLPASREATQMRRATARLLAITRAVEGFEEVYDVKYRPEKPDFFRRA